MSIYVGNIHLVQLLRRWPRTNSVRLIGGKLLAAESSLWFTPAATSTSPSPTLVSYVLPNAFRVRTIRARILTVEKANGCGGFGGIN